MSWGYSANKGGPHAWAKICEAADGLRQSPINIDTSRVVYDESLLLEPLKLGQSYSRNASLKNTGHGFQVTLETDATLSGGPLKEQYSFAQFHAHWGSGAGWGAEHLLDGRSTAAELHLVFWNSSKYASVSEATAHGDGLAVLGVWIQEADGEDFEALKRITERLSDVQFRDDSPIAIDGDVDLSTLLPEKKDVYFTYDGSLTTPPCSECVTWIVFRESIKLSHKQLQAFRELTVSCRCDEDKEQCVDTFRPVCPRGSRVVRTTELLL